MSCIVELGQQRVNEDGELEDEDGGCCVMEKFCYIKGLLFARPWLCWNAMWCSDEQQALSGERWHLINIKWLFAHSVPHLFMPAASWVENYLPFWQQSLQVVWRQENRRKIPQAVSRPLKAFWAESSSRLGWGGCCRNVAAGNTPLCPWGDGEAVLGEQGGGEPLSGISQAGSLAAGVKNADEAELRQVASEPLELSVYNVLDFPLLSSLVGKLTRVLCARIKERSHKDTTGEVGPPFLLLIILLPLGGQNRLMTAITIIGKRGFPSLFLHHVLYPSPFLSFFQPKRGSKSRRTNMKIY